MKCGTNNKKSKARKSLLSLRCQRKRLLRGSGVTCALLDHVKNIFLEGTAGDDLRIVSPMVSLEKPLIEKKRNGFFIKSCRSGIVDQSSVSEFYLFAGKIEEIFFTDGIRFANQKWRSSFAVFLK